VVKISRQCGTSVLKSWPQLIDAPLFNVLYYVTVFLMNKDFRIYISVVIVATCSQLSVLGRERLLLQGHYCRTFILGFVAIKMKILFIIIGNSLACYSAKSKA
jgi:hypothetical protein